MCGVVVFCFHAMLSTLWQHQTCDICCGALSGDLLLLVEKVCITAAEEGDHPSGSAWEEKKAPSQTTYYVRFDVRM
jgi:hypothetical protein